MNEKNTLQEVMQRMKEDNRRLDADLEPPRFDPDDPAAMKQKSDELDELFRERVSLFRSGDQKVGSDEANGWDYPMLKRRKQAILNLLPEAQRRFGAQYPELNVPDQLMRFNAPLANATFEKLNKECYIELAAAIWMLDHLKASDRYDEASRYFPQTREAIESVYLPYLSDAVHSDDELRSMLYIIQNRNKGMNGCHDGVAFGDEADLRLNTGAKEEDSPDRKNFDAIMAMIDRETVCEVQDKLKALIREHFGHLLSAVDEIDRDLRRQKRSLRRAIAALLSEYEKMQIKTPSPLSVSHPQDIMKDVMTEGATVTYSRPDLEQAATDIEHQADELNKGEYTKGSLYFMMLMLPDWVAGNLSEDHNMDVYGGLPIPVIRNPYDICFAFLSLICENSDYAWLYNLCLNTVAFACQALPWADSNVVDRDGNREEIRIDYDYLKSLIEKRPDWNEDTATDKLYELCIPSPLLKNRRVNTSVARLAFLSSGLIPPRSGNSISFTKALLNETDFSEETREMLYNYFALAFAVNHRGDDFLTEDDQQVTEELSEAKSEVKDKDAEIKRLRSRIKHLKSMVNQTEHQNKALSSQLSDVRRELDASNAELAELRSMIRESVDTGEESPTVVSFPYTVNRRTVIIGGHESWVKAIRPLLNNVRYISASENPNPGVILNSDVVWIQTNAMGHSGFYKIIDIIRKNDIKVCYFKYSGAEKCAEQLALEEMESQAEETDAK